MFPSPLGVKSPTIYKLSDFVGKTIVMSFRPLSG